MWKFKYIRVDREEVEIGHYATEGEAKTARDMMVGFGATCSEPFEVLGEAPSADDYVGALVDKFRIYFQNEMAVLETRWISYYIFYYFLQTTLRRIRRFIREEIPPNLNKRKFGEDKVREFALYHEEYLSRVAAIIKEQAGLYGPMDGSAFESLGEDLKKLAREVKTRKVTPVRKKKR